MSRWDRRGWYFDRRFAAWRRCLVLNSAAADATRDLEVELRDGSRHPAGITDFLWQRPESSEARISDD